MLPIILYLLILLCISMAISARLKNTLEQNLPVSCVVSIAFLFPFGLAGIMQIGVIALAVLSLGLGGSAIYISSRKNLLRNLVKNIFSGGMLWFFLALLVLSLPVRGKLFDQYDEFSHWGDVVRATVDLNGFATNAASMSAFQSYPPGMQIFQYLLQKINMWLTGSFSEWKCYFSYNLFLLCFMAPFFSKLSLKKPVSSALLGISILLLPTVFFTSAYYSLYIDAALSCVFGFGLYVLIDGNCSKTVRLMNLCAVCFILPLLKDVGMMLSGSLAVIGWFSFRKKTGKIEMAAVLAAVLIPVILWRMNVRIANAHEVFPLRLDMAELGRVITGQGAAYRQTVYREFPHLLVILKLNLGMTGMGIPFLVLMAGAAAGTWWILGKHGRLEREETAGHRALGIAVPVILLVYCVGLCITYMFQFSEYEAVNFASSDRYLSIPICGICFLMLYCGVDLLCRSSGRLAGLVLCLVLAAAPLENAHFYLSGKVVTDSVKVRGQYSELAEKVNRSAEPGSVIYVISQEDTGKDLWTAHYLFRPNRVNIGQLSGWSGFEAGGYSIGKPYYEGDIWSSDITPEALMEEWVSSYDYVAVFRSNAYLEENYAQLFDGEIKDNTLYMIDREERIARKTAN